MKKLYLIIYILSFLPLSLFAQQDAKAKEVLQKTEQMLKQSNGIRAAFEGSNHGLLLMKGEKFYLNCAGVQSWYDGKTQWSYVEDTEEVNITHPTPEELQGINPYLLMQTYKQGYNYQYKGKQTRNGHTGHEIVLTPKTKRDITSITLLVSEKYIPVYIKVEQGKQAYNEFKVLSCQTNQSLRDDTFVFDRKKFPDAEIIDLR